VEEEAKHTTGEKQRNQTSLLFVAFFLFLYSNYSSILQIGAVNMPMNSSRTTLPHILDGIFLQLSCAADVMQNHDEGYTICAWRNLCLKKLF
jgi:hypothetical protein